MNYLAMLPGLLMAIFGCVTLMLDVMMRRTEKRTWLVWFNLAGEVMIAGSFFEQWRAFETRAEPIKAFYGAVTIDHLALFTNVLVCLSVIVLLLTSYRYLEIVGEDRGEYYAFALFAQCGMYFMASGVDLVT
ncbi:MAG: hypothetical protein JO061_18920, partial [Acidobacteriaceae bacterium]|nr:hypothetical protein [Acidobacteriaceae bacterium]